MIQPNGIQRISETDAYLNVTGTFAYRSTCTKRKYGAVIAKDDVVVPTDYNDSPRGCDNCCDTGKCPRVELGMHQGEEYGICRVVHAERNTLLNYSGGQTTGAGLYLVGANPTDNSVHRAKPCPLYARMIIRAGVRNVIMGMGAQVDEYVVVPVGELT